MENIELQSTFEKINNIKEEVNIEDLVLPSKPTVLLNMETIDIKEEPLEKGSDTVSIHESKTDILNMETIDIKEEPLEEQNSNTMSTHESKKVSFASVQDKNFHSKMENEILKLFEEMDVMNPHDYDQIRVRKVKQLVEKYQRITQKVAFKLLEKTLEIKTNELVKTKQELQMAKSTNLILSKRIQDLELARNQVSGQKDDNLKSDLNFFVKQEESFVEKEVLVNNQETCKHVLARHIKLKQEKMKPYDCNSCNLLFSDEHDLNAHLNSVHECNKQKICSIVGVSSLVLKEVIDENKTINSGSHSIKVNESTALLPQQKRKSFSTNIQKPAKMARVLPPVLSSEDGSKILENQKSAYEKWRMERQKSKRQIYSDQKMLNQYSEKCHFENCEFSSDLKSSLKHHITKRHGPTENVSNTDKSLEDRINADETIQTIHATIDPIDLPSSITSSNSEKKQKNQNGSTARTASIPLALALKQRKENDFPKPAYSYSCLIALSLKNSYTGSLSVSEIYEFICEHFPYFKTAPSGWKNSIRHNLSTSMFFEKTEKPESIRSQKIGGLWAIKPDKIIKMNMEVQKCSRRDIQAIKKGMAMPDCLSALERGEMKKDYNTNNTNDIEDKEDHLEDPLGF